MKIHVFQYSIKDNWDFSITKGFHTSDLLGANATNCLRSSGVRISSSISYRACFMSSTDKRRCPSKMAVKKKDIWHTEILFSTYIHLLKLQSDQTNAKTKCHCTHKYYRPFLDWGCIFHFFSLVPLQNISTWLNIASYDIKFINMRTRIWKFTSLFEVTLF